MFNLPCLFYLALKVFSFILKISFSFNSFLALINDENESLIDSSDNNIFSYESWSWNWCILKMSLLFFFFLFNFKVLFFPVLVFDFYLSLWLLNNEFVSKSSKSLFNYSNSFLIWSFNLSSNIFRLWSFIFYSFLFYF